MYQETQRESGQEKPNKSRRGGLWLLAVGLVVGILIGAVLATALAQRSGSDGAALFNEDAVTRIYDETSQAVVEIDVSRTVGSITIPGLSSGSGFFFDEDGHLMTNQHIVEGGSEFVVRLADGREISAQKLGASSADDLAVLKVDPEEVADIEPLEFADSSKVRPGQLAIAIGSPFREFNSVGVGVVSGIERGHSSVLRRPIPDMIQTDVPLNPGSSGGPLLNSDGKVIGINSAIRTNLRSGPLEEYRIAFAVPSNTAVSILPQLMTVADVRRPWVGISGMPVSREIMQEHGLPSGILVTQVFSDSPAGRAGLRPFRGLTGEARGDIITAVDDVPVHSVDDMVKYLNYKSAGDAVTLSLFSRGEERTIQVTLDPWPDGT